MLHLESGKNLTRYCDSVVALVSDQGTESLISDSGEVAVEMIQRDDMAALGARQHHQSHSSPGDGALLSIANEDFSIGANTLPAASAIECVDSSSEDDASNAAAPACSSAATPVVAPVAARPSHEEVAYNGNPDQTETKTIPKMFGGSN